MSNSPVSISQDGVSFQSLDTTPNKIPDGLISYYPLRTQMTKHIQSVGMRNSAPEYLLRAKNETVSYPSILNTNIGSAVTTEKKGLYFDGTANSYIELDPDVITDYDSFHIRIGFITHGDTNYQTTGQPDRQTLFSLYDTVAGKIKLALTITQFGNITLTSATVSGTVESGLATRAVIPVRSMVYIDVYKIGHNIHAYLSIPWRPNNSCNVVTIQSPVISVAPGDKLQIGRRQTGISTYDEYFKGFLRYLSLSRTAGMPRIDLTGRNTYADVRFPNESVLSGEKTTTPDIYGKGKGFIPDLSQTAGTFTNLQRSTETYHKITKSGASTTPSASYCVFRHRTLDFEPEVASITFVFSQTSAINFIMGFLNISNKSNTPLTHGNGTCLEISSASLLRLHVNGVQVATINNQFVLNDRVELRATIDPTSTEWSIRVYKNGSTAGMPAAQILTYGGALYTHIYDYNPGPTSGGTYPLYVSGYNLPVHSGVNRNVIRTTTSATRLDQNTTFGGMAMYQWPQGYIGIGNTFGDNILGTSANKASLGMLIYPTSLYATPDVLGVKNTVFSRGGANRPPASNPNDIVSLGYDELGKPMAHWDCGPGAATTQTATSISRSINANTWHYYVNTLFGNTDTNQAEAITFVDGVEHKYPVIPASGLAGSADSYDIVGNNSDLTDDTFPGQMKHFYGIDYPVTQTEVLALQSYWGLAREDYKTTSSLGFAALRETVSHNLFRIHPIEVNSGYTRVSSYYSNPYGTENVPTHGYGIETLRFTSSAYLFQLNMSAAPITSGVGNKVLFSANVYINQQLYDYIQVQDPGMQIQMQYVQPLGGTSTANNFSANTWKPGWNRIQAVLNGQAFQVAWLRFWLTTVIPGADENRYGLEMRFQDMSLNVITPMQSTSTYLPMYRQGNGTTGIPSKFKFIALDKSNLGISSDPNYKGSVMFRFYHTYNYGSNSTFIYSGNAATTNTFRVSMNWNGSILYFQFEITDPSSSSGIVQLNVTSTGTLPIGWHWATCTWDRTTGIMQVWIDGSLYGTATTGNFPNVGWPVTIGSCPFDSNSEMDTVMTDLSFYDRVLTVSDIQKIMNPTNSITSSGELIVESIDERITNMYPEVGTYHIPLMNIYGNSICSDIYPSMSQGIEVSEEGSTPIQRITNELEYDDQHIDAYPLETAIRISQTGETIPTPNGVFFKQSGISTRTVIPLGTVLLQTLGHTLIFEYEDYTGNSITIGFTDASGKKYSYKKSTKEADTLYITETSSQTHPITHVFFEVESNSEIVIKDIHITNGSNITKRAKNSVINAISSNPILAYNLSDTVREISWNETTNTFCTQGYRGVRSGVYRTDNSTTGWDAIIRSINRFETTKEGFIEITLGTGLTGIYAVSIRSSALLTTNPGASDYDVRLNAGILSVLKLGVVQTTTAAGPGDIIRIRKTGSGHVYFYHNGSLLFNEAATDQNYYTLFHARHSGAGIEKLVASHPSLPRINIANEDWTMTFWKKPQLPDYSLSNVRTYEELGKAGESIESIRFGLTNEHTNKLTINGTPVTNASFTNEEYFNKFHMVSIQYEASSHTATIKWWGIRSDGQPQSGTYVTGTNNDLFKVYSTRGVSELIFGTDASYKDLVFTKTLLTDQELESIYRKIASITPDNVLQIQKELHIS